MIGEPVLGYLYRDLHKASHVTRNKKGNVKLPSTIVGFVSHMKIWSFELIAFILHARDIFI